MTEDQAKKLIRKSVVATSKGFTDRLLEAIRSRSPVPPLFVWPRYLLLGCSLAILGLITFTLWRFWGMQPGMLSPPIAALAGFAFLWLLHYLFQLKADYQQLAASGSDKSAHLSQKLF